MENKKFKAMVVEETSEKRFERQIRERSVEDLPDGDVLVRVKYSSLNYKDALSATGNRGVTRTFPHTPGIDAAGVVEESTDERFKTGTEVIVTSYDLGMNTSGGFGQYIRVPAGWVVPLPKNLTLKEAMIFGTAGFTAGISVYKLTHTVKPEDGDILAKAVGSCMTASPISTHPGMVLGKAVRMMEDRPSQISVLPVIDPNTRECVGLLRLHDVYQPNLG